MEKVYENKEGYEIIKNTFWKDLPWQVWHRDIGKISDFKSFEEAYNYIKNAK